MGAAGYLVLAPLDVWFGLPASVSLGIRLPELRFDAWSAPATATAAVGAALAVGWAAVRVVRRTVGAAVDAFLGALGLALTALGVTLGPVAAGGRAGPRWGLWAGLTCGGVWAFGSIRRWRLAKRAAERAERGTGFGQP
jgi:hypothetical protein